MNTLKRNWMKVTFNNLAKESFYTNQDILNKYLTFSYRLEYIKQPFYGDYNKLNKCFNRDQNTYISIKDNLFFIK